MNEQVFMHKTLAPGTQALLTQDQCPDNPRKEGTRITTIVAWHSQYEIADTQDFDTRDKFLNHILFQTRPDLEELLYENYPQSLEDCPPALREHLSAFRYPGVIRNLYLHDQDQIALSTTPYEETWGVCQVGYVLIPRETIVELGLSHHEAQRIINQEIAHKQEYANGFVYALSIQRNGQVEETCGDIYTIRETCTDPILGVYTYTRASLPDAQELDSLLAEMELTEEEHTQVTTSPWEQDC